MVLEKLQENKALEVRVASSTGQKKTDRRIEYSQILKFLINEPINSFGNRHPQTVRNLKKYILIYNRISYYLYLVNW